MVYEENAAPPPASVSSCIWDRFPSVWGTSTHTQGATFLTVPLHAPGRQRKMSKELVISANRHETRVAVIEDDQVVEVYHQRENEYSLAGSIHKGRVTRVLPGMQSAFVDIGLGRDAFLYVSDFFEDNEEYDEIVSSVEEKVLKMERTPVQQAPAVAAPVNTPPAGAPEEPVAEFEAAQASEVPAMEAAAPLVAPASAMQ